MSYLIKEAPLSASFPSASCIKTFAKVQRRKAGPFIFNNQFSQMHPPPDNEHALLQRIAEGDNDAFSEVYYFYNRTVYNTVMTYVKDEIVAQEIVQDVFVKLWERRTALSSVRSFRDYFFVSVRNYVFDHFNKLSRQARLYERLKEEQPDEGVSDADHLLIEKQYGEIVDKAIEQLPARQKEVYLLVEKGELDFDQIAERLALSRATVKKHLELARRSVRGYVSTHMQDHFGMLATTGLAPLLYFLIP